MRSRALLNVLSLTEEEEMPIEQAFLRDLRCSIEKSEEKDIHIASQTYKPSSLKCIRNMYFQLIGATPEKTGVSSELVGICESGTDRHNRLQLAITDMKKNGIDCEYVDVGEYVISHNLEDSLEIKSKNGNETKLYNKVLNISFLCDGIIKYKGKYYILEIKTETANKFWDQTAIMPEHLYQGTAYSVCLGIDNVLFLYENRDTCGKKSYLLEVTDEMKHLLVAKILECDDYVEKKECPPKPATLTKRDCSYCPYSKVCKSTY